ncbi:MAG TPA: hypothetical protein VLA61_20465 [Ideonella sp.]|uniref:hypothetical protein n=1 Tax=Ideonella sp. TaxID=1929293 RepID=UPI002BC47D9B|nr:hypothetical protein [Ideonella sp.]HSI50650.1 hypothetical protein [Ideonella sp.]
MKARFTACTAQHAGKVLAMWEGGSAFAPGPDDLSTPGAVTWQESPAQLPFSAHPKPAGRAPPRRRTHRAGIHGNFTAA